MVVTLTANVPEVVLAFLIVFVPFVLILGAKTLAEWLEGFIKVRRGYFSVNWIMKNHQWKERLVKPKGNDVEIESKPQPFFNNPQYTAFKGSKKMIFFSRIGDRLRQLMITGNSDKDFEKNKGIPPENEFNDMLDAAEISGSLLGFKKTDLEKWLLYIAVFAAAGALVLGVINLNMLTLIDGKINTTQQIQTQPQAAPQTPAANPNIPSNATIIR